MGFKYLPLTQSAGDIRVVDLEPSSEHEAEICLKMWHVPLTSVQRGRYEALSYTWGESNDITTIRVDGSEMQVTRNLESALRHLRHHEKSRILWVDAICIYSDRTAMKHLGNLKFVPQFSEGFDFCLGGEKVILRAFTRCEASGNCDPLTYITQLSLTAPLPSYTTLTTFTCYAYQRSLDSDPSKHVRAPGTLLGLGYNCWLYPLFALAKHCCLETSILLFAW